MTLNKYLRGRVNPLTPLPSDSFPCSPNPACPFQRPLNIEVHIKPLLCT